MALQSAAEAREALRTAEGLLLDWDGCVAFGDRLESAALELIETHRDRVAIVSNNTTHLPEYFSECLASQGIRFPPERVVLAGAEALARAQRRGAARTMLIGSPRMKAEARRLGMNLARDEADLVVLLRDNRFSYGKLERAVNAIRRGAALIVGNPDLTHPGPQGRIVPETGALLAAVEACLSSRDIAAEVVGKPERALFETGCRVLGVAPGEAVMIGDNPATDMAGALALGMAGVLVGPHSGLALADLLP
ncbi:HAD-IIA family hydrolase [Phenylobacterium sp.]|uniref:HAD-IIA family hydrolase n=1 Tax=Phenylobacterium sp. TaxID=1871053 RepID=UPI003919E4DA